MTHREGPRASVALSCVSCVHRKETKTRYTLRLECDANGRSMTIGFDTPSWCPFHPGALVAVPLKTIKQVERGEAGVPETLIDAQALGQEIPND